MQATSATTSRAIVAEVSKTRATVRAPGFMGAIVARCHVLSCAVTCCHGGDGDQGQACPNDCGPRYASFGYSPTVFDHREVLPVSNPSMKISSPGSSSTYTFAVS